MPRKVHKSRKSKAQSSCKKRPRDSDSSSSSSDSDSDRSTGSREKQTPAAKKRKVQSDTPIPLPVPIHIPVAPADAVIQQNIRKLVHSAPAGLALDAIPQSVHQVHLLNGMSSIGFLRSFATDTIKVSDIGIDGSGRLFNRRVRRDGAVQMDAEYSTEYTEAVDRNQKNLELTQLKKKICEQIDEFRNFDTKHLALCGGASVDLMNQECRITAERQGIPRCEKLENYAGQVLEHFDKTPIPTILDARAALELKPRTFGAAEWVKLKRDIRVIDTGSLDTADLFLKMETLLEEEHIVDLLELIDEIVAPFCKIRDTVVGIKNAAECALSLYRAASNMSPVLDHRAL
ncbi:hypothetical protein QBC47DRAFT_414436 [Echria macrotheca]|uniref:Uncharacterized protein n=1 Tax=Echria macrotheca TaxID=438768 RepID=A0AAJ0BCD3_9PEZI|nr:hypothetical protein QBC47DRAFT_414436 [Echria macrotheca]